MVSQFKSRRWPIPPSIRAGCEYFPPGCSGL